MLPGDLLYVYVAGEFGDSPLIVAYSLESAMIRLLGFYSVPGDREAAGYPEEWACRFVEGETADLLWTLSLPARGENPPARLYILKCEVEPDKWNENGWQE